MVNIRQWESLPAEYKAILEAACAEAYGWMTAKYDAQNPAAMRRLIAGGAVPRQFSREIMQACFNAANQLYEETMAKNAKFKKIYEPWVKFRDEQIRWFTIAEAPFDNFMATTTRQPAPVKKG
jgi:TRAP-type mannitol/chloroaromatic compound transport system substrate-binding protein